MWSRGRVDIGSDDKPLSADEERSRMPVSIKELDDHVRDKTKVVTDVRGDEQ